MNAQLQQHIQAAEVVLPCANLSKTLDFFTQQLGFKILTIFPADDPAVAIVSGYGLRLRLQRDNQSNPGVLRLLCKNNETQQQFTAPNGTIIQLVPENPPLAIPELREALVITRISNAAQWVTGRAGMRYRDLIPGRLGGRFIASHIHIPTAGPVPDYVHYHKIRFQMIYCYKGWVRVVYEDQGPDFVMQAGDCVLQPPEIRHRVLECSAGLEVIEIGCPAEHETWVDHDLTLPTAQLQPERDYSGQRFVSHQAAAASWQQWKQPGFEYRDMGIAATTNGLAGVKVVRSVNHQATSTVNHNGEFLFIFILTGQLQFSRDGQDDVLLTAGDSVTIPAKLEHALVNCSAHLEFLQVTLPA